MFKYEKISFNPDDANSSHYPVCRQCIGTKPKCDHISTEYPGTYRTDPDSASCNVHFVYEEKNINSQQTVTLNYPQGTSLSTLLNNLCKQIGLTYEINESVILLYPAQKQTTTHDIHILLLERGNKQPLPMATCVLNPLGAYAATDMEGKAVLKNVPTGKYILKYFVCRLRDCATGNQR